MGNPYDTSDGGTAGNLDRSHPKELEDMTNVLRKLADQVEKEALASALKFREKRDKKAARKAKSNWGKK
jgi:hypothetical protein